MVNSVLCYHEKKMVRQKPRGIQTTVLQAICGFTLHKGRAPLFFLNYFNSHHENIKFTSEKETNSKLFFLEIEISKDKDQFITSVYCKPTFGNYFLILIVSFPGVINSTLIFCCYSICCSTELFHIENMQLKEIFEKNGCDNKFFDRCFRMSRIF